MLAPLGSDMTLSSCALTSTLNTVIVTVRFCDTSTVSRRPRVELVLTNAELTFAACRWVGSQGHLSASVTGKGASAALN
jgi:hypothetical protein